MNRNFYLAKKDNYSYDAITEVEQLELASYYTTLHSELTVSGLKSKEHKNLLVLKHHRQMLDDTCCKTELENIEVNKAIAKNFMYLEEIKCKQQEASDTLHKLTEAKDKKENVKELEELVVLNDCLRGQELQFREYCKQELSRLQNFLEEGSGVQLQCNAKNSSVFEDEVDNIKSLRLQLAKKNRSIVAMQRQFDEVPSRAELAQYQRRFLELYNQVAAKHKETKQYFTLYNTLNDSRLYIKKELSLLNSVLDSYPEAMQTHNGKEDFLKQFESIVDGVKQTKIKVGRKLAEEKHYRDKLSHTLQSFIEQQRRYVAAVRQLGIECQKNENIMAKHEL